MNPHALAATRLVDQLVSQWRAAPRVTVVEIVDDLPCKTYDDTKGMLHRGQAWIVANACTKSEVVETLAHEVVGHHAMRQALGGLWRPFMQALHAGARDDHRLSMIQRRVTGVYVDGKNGCYLSALQQGDEMAAHLAEWRIRPDTGRLDVARPARKMAKAAVGHLSREGLYMDSPADFEELEGNLLLAEHKLRFGGHLWGVGYWLKRWYAARMPKFDPKAAPMSLDESERLLKSARDSEGSWNEFWLFVHFLPSFALALLWVIFVVAAGAFVISLLMRL